MEQVKQKKQPASSVHERPTTRQEQYHDEQTSKQSNIQTSYKESQQAKQERPAVKSDFSSPKVERQGNTVQEKPFKSQQLQPLQQIELHNVQSQRTSVYCSKSTTTKYKK